MGLAEPMAKDTKGKGNSDQALIRDLAELLEETGYGGGRWSLLMTLSANPALQTNLTYTFLAEDVVAMKAADPERAHGAILGKAMSSLEAGTGLVLVLVSLQ